MEIFIVTITSKYRLFCEEKFIAIAGIGNPENFFQLLEKNNLNIKKLVFQIIISFLKMKSEILLMMQEIIIIRLL